MFDSGWFWIFVVFFFIWGPVRWGRGHGRGRGAWHGWGWDQRGDASRERERPSREDVERQQQRDAQVEGLEARVAELESRLDFAERLLAPRRDQVHAPPS